MSWWVIFKHTCPHPSECSAVFDQKTAPPSLFTCYYPERLVFVFPDEKFLEGKRFANVEEVKQKAALKGIKVNKFKNFFERWKKVSIGVLHQMEITLKVTEVQTCKNVQVFINKFHLGGPPSHIPHKRRKPWMGMINTKFKKMLTSAKWREKNEIEEGYSGDINCVCNILTKLMGLQVFLFLFSVLFWYTQSILLIKKAISSWKYL